jgi:excisionase family DNA binding protein
MKNQRSKTTAFPAANSEPVSSATPAITEEPFISVDEGASLLSVPPNTLYKWALARRVKSYKIGKLRRFRRSELLAFAESHLVNTAE